MRRFAILLCALLAFPAFAAIQYIPGAAGQLVMFGLSSDTKPTIANGHIFVETDTAKVFVRTGGVWVESTNAAYQPAEATLTDIADGTIAEDLVNTGNPWADNEVSDTLTASISSTAAANDSDTSIATTAFVQQEIDDGDLLTDNCTLENDATPIPDSCVGDGSDSTGTGANPTASIGLSAVNGVATTFLRSDGAPALDVAIAPTWTGLHTWSRNENAVSTLLLDNDSNGTGNAARWSITSGDANVALYAAGSGLTSAIVTSGPTGAQGVLRTVGNYPLVFATNNTYRWSILGAGGWDVGGSEGSSGQALVSNGAGAAPTWQTPSISTTASANDNDTSIATTAFVQQEIDDGDLLTDNCVLENDATPIPDSCVGDGSDAGGGGGGITYADAVAASLAGF